MMNKTGRRKLRWTVHLTILKLSTWLWWRPQRSWRTAGEEAASSSEAAFLVEQNVILPVCGFNFQ